MSMEASLQPHPALLRIHKCVGEKKFDEVENEWMELAEEPELSSETLDGLVAAAREIAAAGDRDRAGALLELILPQVSAIEPGRSAGALRCLDFLSRLFPTREAYRTLLVEHFESRHAPTTPERAFFECCGIKEEGDSARALERLDRLLLFRPGACVYHAAGWGVGEVLAVDPFLKQVKVDLERKKQHRIAIAVVDKILEPLPDDGFLALLYRRREDDLKRLAREEPDLLVEKVLEAFGSPLALKEIRVRLVPAVIEEGGWTRWWSAAKRKLRDSGYFRIGDRAPYHVEKLDAEVSYDSDLLERYHRGDWPEKRKTARCVLRSGERKFPASFSFIRQDLLEIATSEGLGRRALEAAIWLSKSEPREEGREVLRRAVSRAAPDEIFSVLEGSVSPEDIRIAVRALSEDRPSEAEDLLGTAFRLGGDSVRQAICDLLEQRPSDALLAAIGEIVRSPRLGPQAFCWIVEQKLGGSENSVTRCLDSRSPGAILGLVLDLLEHIVDRLARGESQGETRDSLRRVEALLYHGAGSFFREAMEEFSGAARRDAHRQLVRCANHLPRMGGKLLDLIAAVEPRVAEEAAPGAWWDVDAIFVTAEGLARRKAEFRELMEVKIPQNFDAVGKAAGFGDLSENAEFTSALEEQGHLTMRAAQMKAELDRARVLSSVDVKGDVTGPGSRVRVRDLDTGEEISYSILGPWDASPEEGVLNYLSPLGGVFLGRRLDEEFAADLPSGRKRYRLLEIGSHFKPPGSSPPGP